MTAPILNYDLQPKQATAFFSDATEILYGGAAGGGKSHLMRIAAIIWCLEIIGLQVYLFRRVSSDLLKNHMEGPTGFIQLLLPLVGSGHVRINHSKGEINFNNGSKIYLCHCQHEKDRFKYQGPELHVLMIDELTHFTEVIYNFLRSRVRMTGIDLPEKYQGKFPRILCGSNPGGVGHTFVKFNFVDYAKELEVKIAPDMEGGMRRQYIPAKLDDNKILLDSDPLYKARLQGLGNEALVKAMLDGDWDIVLGGAVDDVWSRDIHIIEPFDIPKSWAVDRSFDWGSSHPFSIGWWAESDGSEVELKDGTTCNYPPGTLFRIDELYGWNGRPNEGCRMTAKEQAELIINRENTFSFKVKPGPADNSINDVRDSDTPSIASIHEENGIEWELSDKKPGSRINGLELFRTRLKNSLQFPMEESGLFVFNTCHHFIRTVPVLPRAETNPEDVDTKSEDHIWDECRYRVLKSAKISSYDFFTKQG